MLSINTNLPSIIAQNSLKNSTLKLNTAVERMSTGFKINHAKDNAANYSISTNMTTKIGAYQVAEDNCAMGLDLLSTANESLNLISDKLARLRALAEQASNGTYGEQSLNAINTEARAIIDETNRIFNTTEYNGQKLFGHAGRFLEDITTRNTNNMGKMESVDANVTITSGTYSISSAEELAKLAEMANNGKIQGGEFVLANDIDLSAYSSGSGWNPIGNSNNSANHFKGTFDGNGYVISNLYINRGGQNNIGLFGAAEGCIKNLGVENVNITGADWVGAIVGSSMNKDTGGYSDTELNIQNCYVKNGTVTSTGDKAGGIAGYMAAKNSSIKSCWSNADITVRWYWAGGILGESDSENIIIEDSFSNGNTMANAAVAGGLIGGLYKNNAIVRNCYATGNATAKNEAASGLIGQIYIDNSAEITNCYATGNVTVQGNSYGNAGGLIAVVSRSGTVNISNSYSTSNVSSNTRAGGFIGLNDSSTNTININNCYASGNITGTNYTSQFVSYNDGTLNIQNSYALGKSEKIKNVFVSYNRSKNNVKIDNCKYSSYYDDLNKALTPTSVNKDNITNISAYDGKEPFKLREISFNFQVGINGDTNAQIDTTTSFSLFEITDLYNLGLDNKDYLSIIDKLTNKVSAKQTELGASQNRLESALDEISTQYENLVSSRSTLRDADIAEVSSEYIRQQILQQASATLLSTANQTPALALQLL